MKLFSDPLKSVEQQALAPLVYKFIAYEDFLFERIMYIRNVLANPDKYKNTPDTNYLLLELYELLGKYQDIIFKKVKIEQLEE